MAGSAKGVLAVIIVPGGFIFAVSLRDISVQALAEAGTFQDTGKDVSMILVMDLFSLIGILSALRLCQVPVLFADNRLVMTFVQRILRLLNDMSITSKSGVGSRCITKTGLPSSARLFCSCRIWNSRRDSQ